MKQFLIKMFSGQEDVSSKRVNATLCILTTLLIVTTALYFELIIPEVLEGLIKMIFYGGILMLGFNVVEKFKI